MRRVDMEYLDDQIAFEKHPVPTRPCDDSRDFLADQNKNFITRNFTSFTCLDTTDIFFTGTVVSQKHSYLHFEILACDQDNLETQPGYENATCAEEKEL